MDYLVVFKQAGEGCDYTIGCGVKVGFVKADSAAEALAKLMEPDYDPDGATGMEWVRVCALGSDDNGETWKEWAKARRADIAKANEAAARKKEEAEYERLKKRLGK